jgi:hypothetical protein
VANNKRITHPWDTTGIVVYCIIRREADNYRMDDSSGSFAETPSDPHVSLVEDSVIKGTYELNESRTVWNNGRYIVIIYSQTGGSPAPASDIIIGGGEIVIKSDLEVFLDVKLSTHETARSTMETTLINKIDAVQFDLDNPNQYKADVTALALETTIAALNNISVADIEGSTVLAKEATLSRLLGLCLENHVEDDIVRDGQGNKESSILYCYNSAVSATTHDKSTGVTAKYAASFTFVAGKMTLGKIVKL